LATAADEGPLVINAIIYAEVSIGFGSIEELDDALPPEIFSREHLPYEAGFLAGKAFLAYRRRGGARSVPLPDFYIGAHAAINDHRILARDPWRYRTYFPTVRLVAPSGLR
jgi:predicted nucleic acid-binding protein